MSGRREKRKKPEVSSQSSQSTTESERRSSHRQRGEATSSSMTATAGGGFPPPRQGGPTDSEIMGGIRGGNITPAIDAIMKYPEVNPYLRGLMMEKLKELEQLIAESERQQAVRMRGEEEAMGEAEQGRVRINQARVAVVRNMTDLLNRVDESHASNVVIEGIMNLILQNSGDIRNTVDELGAMKTDRQIIQDAQARELIEAGPGYNYEVHRILIDLLGGSIYTSLLHGLNRVRNETFQFLQDSRTRATALLLTTLIITNLPEYFGRLTGNVTIASTGLALFYSAPVLRAGTMLTSSLSCGLTGACSILQVITQEGIIRPTQGFIMSVFENLRNIIPENLVTRRLGESLKDFCGSLYPVYDDGSVSSKESTRSNESVMSEIENLTQQLEANHEMEVGDEMKVGGAIAGIFYPPATVSGEMPLEVIVPPPEVIVADEIGAVSDISSSQGSESKALSSQGSESKASSSQGSESKALSSQGSSSQDSESKGLYEDIPEDMPDLEPSVLPTHEDEEHEEEKGGTKRKRRRKSNKNHTKKQVKKGGRKKRRTQKNKRKNKRKTNKK
jgi:hypothetical protein